MRIAFPLFAVALSACANKAPSKVVPDPTTINLKEALIQVVDALHSSVDRASQYKTKLGYDVCSVQVTFDITASGTNTNELVVDASIKPPGPVAVGLDVKGSNQDVLKADRGNHIIVNFNTPACNPKDTLGTAHPEKVGTLATQNEWVRAGGKTQYFLPLRQ